MQNKDNKTQAEKQITKRSLEQIFKESNNGQRLGIIQCIINMYLKKEIKDNEAMTAINKLISGVAYSEITSKNSKKRAV